MNQARMYSRHKKIKELKKLLHASYATQIPGVKTGFSDIDALIARHPHDGLAVDGLHIVEAASIHDMPAALGFSISLALRLAGDRPLIWVQHAAAQCEWGVPYLLGLNNYGLAPERLWYVTARTTRDWSWAIEEVTHCPEIGCAFGVAMPGTISFTMSRRLMRAAQNTTRPALLVSPPQGHALAADSHWRVGAGANCSWQVELRRQRQRMHTTAQRWHISHNPASKNEGDQRQVA